MSPEPNVARGARERLSILALEPWMRGSHERFLDQWRRRSRHDVRVLGLPGRDWKWRMRSSSFELGQRIAEESIAAPDVIFASDYVDLAALFGWLPPAWADVPCVLYFHENQLTYPLRPDSERNERDLHFGFTNILSALRAARVVFNSRYHRDDFARASDELLSRMPRPNPRSTLRAKIDASDVIAPGIDLEEIALGTGGCEGEPLRVLFNHRWEHDKDPLAFLAAVREVVRGGAELELVLMGEDFDDLPPGAGELLAELEPVIRERGFVADRALYAQALGQADVAVSCARHEFFGISIAEAMAAGCTPLAPRRLAYPELVPAELQTRCLFADSAELVLRLGRAASDPRAFRAESVRRSMRAAVEGFAADACARRLDEVAGSTRESLRKTSGASIV